MDEKEDLGSTTAVYEKVGLGWLPRALRNRLTPGRVGSAIAGLSIAIWYVVNDRHDVIHLKETVTRLEQELANKQAAEEREQDRELLHKLETAVDVMNAKWDDMQAEVNRQRERWDRVEQVADSPPHARRRR